MDEAPETVAELPQDTKALLRHLEKTNPETLALARDWEDTAYSIDKTKERIKLCALCFFPCFSLTDIPQD